ncbi:hypothetical protein [Acanthopleuribacter pedis]|uniref:Uncharacterized protein n=1 Tax=Acanthopleuribacter pedis TaxID=442870 RepID=A0A8J7U7Y9_9BACT|nr:hypothetical protein [Acanthopleuribacter pedis]MBO1321906.1 hypothetical protein [Acanthopleuribacter pedis]
MENPFGTYAAAFARDLNLPIDDRMLVEGFTATVADQHRPDQVLRLAVMPGRSGEEVILACNIGTVAADRASAVYGDLLDDALLPGAFNMNYYLDPNCREVTAAAVLSYDDLSDADLRSYAEAFLQRAGNRLRGVSESKPTARLDWHQMTAYSQSFV